YFWINRPAAHNLAEPLEKIRSAATAAVDEYDKVVRVRRDTERQMRETQQSAAEILNSIGRFAFNSVADVVAKLAALRQARGQAVGLRELRYIDQAAVQELETKLAEAAERLGQRCVQFLLNPNSL